MKAHCVQGRKQLFLPFTSHTADQTPCRSGSHSHAGISVHSFPAWL